MNDWSDAETHVERAHEAYEDGRWADAEQELRHALALNPYRAEWHFNLALTLEAAGRYKDAVEALRDCHRLDDQDPQVALLLGVNCLRTDDFRAAIGWLELAQKLNPAAVESYAHRIEAYARLGDHEQAEVMFYLAQQIDTAHAPAYANLAESLLSRGQNEKAVWCLREAAHHDPEMPRIHARLAEAYAATGRLERARQLLLRELRNDPGDTHVLLDLGSLLSDMDRLGEAAEKFRRVLEIEPDNAEAHFFLGDLADRQSQPVTALEHFGVALRLDHDFPAARTRIAALLLRRSGDGDREAARTLLSEEFAALKELIADLPGAENGTGGDGGGGGGGRFGEGDALELGRALLDAQLPTEARVALRFAAREAPADPAAAHALSIACFTLGERAEGMRWARRCLRLDPRHIAAMHNLAVASLRGGRCTLARAWVRKALRIAPDDAALRRLRTRITIAAVAEWLHRPVFRGSGRERR